MTERAETEFTVTLLPDPHWNYGGQHVGTPNSIIRIDHEETHCAVEFQASYRISQHRAKQIALTLCRLAVDEATP